MIVKKRALDAAQRALLWRQLGALLRGGLPLPDALLALGRDAETAVLRRVIDSVRGSVEEGEPFSAALSLFPRDFGPEVIACVNAGERTGELAATVAMLADFSEKAHSMRLRAGMVLTYPIILWLFSLLMCGSLYGWIVPTAISVSESLTVKMPLFITVAIRALFVMNVVLLLSVLLALATILAYRMPGRLPWVRHAVDGVLLKIPIWGRYYRALILARVMRTLSILLRAGVPLHESLVVAGEAAGNTRVAEELRRASSTTRDGERATEALRSDGVFSPASLWALRVAEQRGDFEETLEGLSSYFEETAAIGAATFLTAAEPLAIAVVGLFSAATILALAAPTVHLYAVIP